MSEGQQYLAPEKSGVAAVAEAVAKVQARADQKRREAAEAEVRKVLDKRGVADLLAYHLSGGSGDEPQPKGVPLNSSQLSVDL